MSALDRFVNGSHARHYVTQSAGQHSAIVRFQERVAELEAENAALRAENHRLKHDFTLPYGFDDVLAAVEVAA